MISYFLGIKSVSSGWLTQTLLPEVASNGNSERTIPSIFPEGFYYSRGELLIS